MVRTQHPDQVKEQFPLETMRLYARPSAADLQRAVASALRDLSTFGTATACPAGRSSIAPARL